MMKNQQAEEEESVCYSCRVRDRDQQPRQKDEGQSSILLTYTMMNPYRKQEQDTLVMNESKTALPMEECDEAAWRKRVQRKGLWVLDVVANGLAGQ